MKKIYRKEYAGHVGYEKGVCRGHTIRRIFGRIEYAGAYEFACRSMSPESQKKRVILQIDLCFVTLFSLKLGLLRIILLFKGPCSCIQL